MIAGLIQSRMDSRRLPRKALYKLNGIPIIEHCINAIKRTAYYTPILITSDRNIDDPLIEIAIKNNIQYYRGSLNNVAERAMESIKLFNISFFARINGDSPFTRPELLDMAFKKIITQKNDFVSNLIKRKYPYGVSVELLDASVFLQSYESFKNNAHYQEHYTKFFYDNLSKYSYSSIVNTEDLSGIQLTIDTAEDYQRINEILEENPYLLEKSIHELSNYLKK